MTDDALHVLSAGAAKAVVTALAGTFRHGDGVVATFDAAGAIRAHLLARDPCDVVILPMPMLEALADDGHVARESIATLGRTSNATCFWPLAATKSCGRSILRPVRYRS